MNAGKSVLYDPYGCLDANISNITLSESSTIQQLRSFAEVWLVLPIAVLGIAGNIASFIVLCHHRRYKLQTVTVLLQVCLHMFFDVLHFLVITNSNNGALMESMSALHRRYTAGELWRFKSYKALSIIVDDSLVLT